MMHWLATALIAMLAAGEPRLEPAAVVVSPDGVGFEIVAYEPIGRTLWATRTDRPRLTRFDLAQPASPAELGDADLSRFGSEVTSVAAHDRLVAATVIADRSTDPGTLVLLDAEGSVLLTAPTGAHPDMVTFSPDGRLLLVANEGEPSGGVDPDGSVSVYQLERNEGDIRISRQHLIPLGVPGGDKDTVTWLTPLAETPASMVEPEYIVCAPDSRSAYVSCQENNGIAVIDLSVWPPRLTAQLDLGVHDHASGSPIDLERDGSLRHSLREVRSLPQPDAIAVVETEGGLRLLTADEGDPRDDWGGDGVSDARGFEHTRVAGEDAAPILFGSRGVSLWTLDGERLSASESIGPWLEERADAWPAHAAQVDKRSPKRGPEPEGVVAWSSGGASFAAVGYERAGAIGLYRVRADSLELIDVHMMPAIDGEIPSPEGLTLVRTGSSQGPAYVVVADEAAGTLSVLAIIDPESGRSSP